MEIVISLTLSMILVGAAWSMISLQSRASVEASNMVDRLDAARVVRGVLGGEVREGRRGRDWTVLGSESLELRAFRGVAIPCGPALDEVALVSFRGMRRPDPRKDSVLVLRADGRRRAVGLVSAAQTSDSAGAGPGPCSDPADSGSLEEWTLDGFQGDFVTARIFEPGSYHLDDGAFRYRSGAGGRQPLTPDLLDDGRSGWEVSSAGSALRLRVGFRPGPGGQSPSEREFTLWLHHP